jgi:hypothetical protein
MIGPLISLLVFDLIVAVVYAVLGWLSVAIQPQLMRLMIGIVLLINLLVVLSVLLGLLGYPGLGRGLGPAWPR